MSWIISNMCLGLHFFWGSTRILAFVGSIANKVWIVYYKGCLHDIKIYISWCAFWNQLTVCVYKTHIEKIFQPISHLSLYSFTVEAKPKNLDRSKQKPNENQLNLIMYSSSQLYSIPTYPKHRVRVLLSILFLTELTTGLTIKGREVLHRQ